MEDKSLYTLPVRENGRAALYYCLVTALGDGQGSCAWALVREHTMLSTGACADEDVPMMLNALREDLNGVGEWRTTTIH